jgi:hypothetical protein
MRIHSAWGEEAVIFNKHGFDILTKEYNIIKVNSKLLSK